MPASVIEQILARNKAALLNATSAGAHVFRGREDPFSPEEIPGLNVRRDDSEHQPMGDNGQRVYAVWEVEHVVKGDNWETAADALHMEVHAVLADDATLKTLGRGLRCIATSCRAEGGDQTTGKLTARYQMQVFVRPGDLSRAVS
jgi:hypothetical protein